MSDVPAPAPAPQAVALISPSGEAKVVSPADAQTYVALGYQLDTPETRAALERQATAASPIEDAKAFGAGLARGATVGLSDLALTRAGLVKPETLQTLREDHPGSTLAGEFTGVLSPLGAEALAAKAASGAVKVGATAAKIASAPAAAVSAVGGAVERGVASVIANQTAARIAGMTARGTAEALAYNVGNNITEAALGDYELTAEKLLAHSGEAALIGGGLGFGVSAATEGLRAVLSKARDAGKGAAATAADVYAKGVSKLAGADDAATAETIDLLAKPFDDVAAAARKEKVDLFVSPEERNRLHRQLTEQLTELHEGVREAKRYGALRRPEETARLAATVEAAPAKADLESWIAKARTTADAMDADAVMHAPVYAKELRTIADATEKKLADGFDNAAEVFDVANEIKRKPLADLAEFKKDLGNADRTVQNSVRNIRGLYDDLAKHLENPANYGEAAARQQSYNAAMSDLLDLEKHELRTYLLRKTSPGNYEVDTEKVNRMLNRFGSERDRHMVGVLERYEAAAGKLFDEVEKTAVSTDGAYSAAGMRSLIEKTQGVQGEAAKKLAAASQIRAQDAFGMALKNWLKDLGLEFGTIGAAARVVGGAASPYTVAKVLSRIESGVLVTDRVVDSAIKAFAKGAQAKTLVGKVAADKADVYVPPILRQRVGDDERPKKLDPKEATKRAIEYVTNVAVDPLAATDRMGAGLSQLAGTAPQTRNAVIQTQLRVANFLATKVPKNPFAAYPGMQWEPADSELATFHRYVEAASNPLAVLEQMSTGYVTVEAAEAVKECYPKLFADIQARFAARAGEIRQRSTYEQRVALSRVFGVALDPTTEPAFTSWMQSQFAAQPVEKRGGGGGGEMESLGAGMTSSETRAARQGQ